MKRLLRFSAAILLMTSSAPAYYHYIHYLNTSAPYLPVPEKFDLAALPNRTVTFLVSDSGPSVYAPGDNFASVLSQIRQAAQTWNSVESSELRVAFGGLFSPGMPQSTPSGEIVFDELPPGILGFGGPTSRAEVVSGPNGAFVPITRAVVRMNRDLTRRPGPSYTEIFFATVLHEMGHALGLQHTASSSAMTVALNRSTFRLKPLEADDIAGISLLYPTRGFLEDTGTISGRVMSGGQGIHLASVVAIRPGNSAVSALTNPDGSYEIKGLPADQYLVYVHPLRRPAQEGLGPEDIQLPLYRDGRSVPAGDPFETLFFPGTRQPSQALPLSVTQGGTVENVNFSVQRRAGVAIYDVEAFSFFGTQATKPAFLNSLRPSGTLVIRGVGLTQGSGATPGLSIQMLGSAAAQGIRAYGNPVNLAVDFSFGLFAGTGPRHLIFSTPTDIHVFPSAVHLVHRDPPSINGIFSNQDGALTITGSNIEADSRFFFDGIPASLRSVERSGAGAIAQVIPPPGAGNEAVVTVYNPDGQNSTFTQAQGLPTFSYHASEPGAVQFEPAALPAGIDSVIEVRGINTQFGEGQTALGFGTSDILVNRIWVLSPTHLLASVSIAPNAFPASTLATVVNGFQVITQPFGFQVLPRISRGPWVSGQAVNANPGQTSLYPGSTMVLTGANLTAAGNGANTTVTIGKATARIVFANATQLGVEIPPEVPPGPAVVTVSNGIESAYPIVVQIDPVPPVISSLRTVSNTAVTSARPGDLLNLEMRDPSARGELDTERLRVRVGNCEFAPVAVSTEPDRPGIFRVQWLVPSNLEPGPAQVVVKIDGRTSDPVTISVLKT